MTELETTGDRVRQALAWATAVLLFALAYGQSPLFHGNYNTYLLHGFALADVGELSEDWLANTVDAFPVFSALVAVVARLGIEEAFYLGHGLLLGVGLLALVGLCGGAFARGRPIDRAVLATLLALPLTWAGRDAVSWVFDGDWGWYLQSGVAMQYVMGHMFQPSLFGVFCIASLAAFVHRKDRFAAALAAGAAVMHFSYFLTATGLCLGYVLVRFVETRDRRNVLKYGAIVAAMLAVAALPALRFLPTSADASEQATHILTQVRFPHHALVERWIDHQSIYWVQGPLLALGAVCAFRTRLFSPLAVVAAVGTTLTVTQLVTGSETLALMFPWRVTVILVPVSFGLTVTRASRRLWARAPSRLTLVGSVVILTAAAAHGFLVTRQQSDEYRETPERLMMDEARGLSTSETLFVVPRDLQRFRLETGASTFVDYKSHPYRDDEVVEWHVRLELADALDHEDPREACAAAFRVRERYGATHFVRHAARPLVCDGMSTVFEDESFVISTFE